MKALEYFTFAAGIVLVSGCAGGRSAQIPQAPQSEARTGAPNATSAFQMDMLRPDAPNPGSLKVPPMPVKARVSSSIMLEHTPHSVLPQSIGTMKYSQIPGSAAQVVASPDGTLWALSTQPAGSNKYIFHYANGTWTNVPGAASNIAIDESGTQLFAVNAVSGGAGKIGRMTTTGQLTEFPLPSGEHAVPFGIAPGPDGNIWYTDGGTVYIGRITPAGVATEFPPPTPEGFINSFPLGITTGADGNLYFTDFSSDFIGRIGPSNP